MTAKNLQQQHWRIYDSNIVEIYNSKLENLWQQQRRRIIYNRSEDIEFRYGDDEVVEDEEQQQEEEIDITRCVQSTQCFREKTIQQRNWWSNDLRDPKGNYDKLRIQKEGTIRDEEEINSDEAAKCPARSIET